jgi:S-adenosylmethionine-diacylglycerol 3-amino-3-carboxypropyl transferase
MPRIDYAQCWEDHSILRQGLAITPEDDVLSIASGGDNTFALLLDRPRRIIAIDRNPAQLYLVELKARAIEHLAYEEFIGFVGAVECGHRAVIYRQLRSSLRPSTRAFWDRNVPAIAEGVLGAGRFERYLAAFRSLVLPCAPGRRAVTALLQADSLQEQRAIYERWWNTRRWRLLFRIAFSRFLLGRYARSGDAFRCVPASDIGSTLLGRARFGLTTSAIAENHFLQYILTGRYANLESSHAYLSPANFSHLKERISLIEMVEDNVAEFLRTVPPGSLSAFNLSDVFEYLNDEEFTALLGQLLRAGRQSARLAFWTVFVPRSIPGSFRDCIMPNPLPFGVKPWHDRGFFYQSFNSWRIGRQRSRMLTAVAGWRRTVNKKEEVS